MMLKVIKETSVSHPGYGAGSGTIITTVYSCPCGKGTITKVKDAIPGFRETDITIDCPECRAKYGNIDKLSDLDEE